MIRTCALAALTAGAFALAAPAAVAQPRGGVSDSLGGMCRNVQQLSSGYVTAECRDAQGRYLWSSIYYPQCRSELTSRDGMLTCYGAQASGGNYVGQSSAQPNTVGGIIGALAGALLGGGQPLYAPGAQYPAWGEQGYGDPRYDPRFGEQGWGYGAQGQWVPIPRRQAWLERRIATGERNGRLTRAEAASLRREAADLARLETRYSRDGLSNTERADLDRRFDALSARIRLDSQDGESAWSDMGQRRAGLDARIDAGVRNGSLTRQEAARLRAEYQSLLRLETSYRRGGLTAAERAELDRRFDQLSDRIRDERRDGGGAWSNINQRQANLDARIDAGVRDGSLSRREAERLRAEFQALARLEETYRRNGLTAAEREDLDRRFDVLAARVRAERRD